MTEQNRPRGMRAFIIIWIGQLVSLIGTGMTNLGIPIWVFSQTKRATDLTLIGGLFLTSLVVVSPLTGVLVDRSNRKFMMIISDLAAGLVTIGIFILYSLGRLQIWHLYASAVIQGAFQSFQWPAFSSAVSVMLPKEQYTRAATMLELAETGSNIIGPIVAAALLGLLGDQRGLQLILLTDIVTFMLAIGTLLFVHVPQPQTTAAQEEAIQEGFIGEVLFGFRYILERPSLLGLQTVFMLGNLFSGASFALMAPLILARTGNNALLFGSVESIGAVGGVVGAIAVSAWGGFKRRVHGVLLGWAFTGLFAAVIGLGRPEPAWAALPVWAGANFLTFFGSPLINGSNQAIWQAKVSPDVQGKVFSIRRLIAWVIMPVSWFVAGPLADRVLEPAMGAGGSLSGVFGWLVGGGPGAGMALMFVFSGLLATCVGLGGYLFPAIRNAEDILPDHDMDGDTADPPADS